MPLSRRALVPVFEAHDLRPFRNSLSLFSSAFHTMWITVKHLILLSCLVWLASTDLLAREWQPNVVFILADDLGWSDTTLYGHTKLYQTPNVERLARLGMTFTRAYSASPLCSPTRSAILTGLSPARTGITTPSCHLPQVVLAATLPKAGPADHKATMPQSVTRLKTDYRTLAKSLKDAGYATGHFGKWHLGPEPYSALQHGFDVDLPHHPGPGPAGSYVAPWKFKDFDPDPAIPDQHIEDRMAQEAATWIKQNRDRPFYLNYWMFSVHAPFDAKKKLIDKYRQLVKADQPQRCPTYAAMVESMDDAIGTLLNTLERLKLLENTIIVFTSDNGGNMYSQVEDTVPTSNLPLRGGKATMFEGGTHVPCVIAWPGVTTPGMRSEALVQSEDYYPTLLAGLGISPSTDQVFDGVSILPALRGQAVEHPPLFQFFPHNPAVPDWLPPSVSVHSGDWKLIRIFHGGNSGEHRYKLFNLRDDLSETRDLSTQRLDMVQQLDDLIEQFLQRTKAVTPQINPAFDPAKHHPELEGQPARESKKSEAKPAASSDPSDPALQGWKARSCVATVSDGILQLRKVTANSFLGYAAGKHAQASTIRMRIKSAAGAAHVDWLPGGAGSSDTHRAAYVIKGSGWEEISIDLPAKEGLGIVRIYLPAQDAAIEIDWIEISSPHVDKTTRTEFGVR